jgi:hypothetical protein
MGGDRRLRTDGGRHQRAGHRTGWTADGWTLDGWTADGDRRTLWTTAPGDRTPDGRTAGSRTPRPDGWTPPAGHRRPTPWRACWPCRPRRRRLSARYRLDAPPGKPSSGEQQPGPRSSKDAEGTHAATDGPGHRRDVSCRWYPPSSWRLGALLSCVGFGWYERRATGQRKGKRVRGQAGKGVRMGMFLWVPK